MANAKGTTMISFVRFLRADLGRALEILPPEHHHYLDERIALSSWYPEEDLLALIRAGTSLLRGEREAALRGFGRADAHEQLGGGIYADLRQSDDPLALPRRVFALWSSRS